MQKIKDIATYFQFADHAEAETVVFRIVKGRYKGVAFEYLNAKPIIDENNDIMNMNFDLKFYELAEYEEKDIILQHHFKQLSGQWLEEQLRMYFNSESE